MVGYENKTIIAQCTPKGAGSIALIRISGSEAINVVEKISALPSKLNFHELASHTIHYGKIFDEKQQVIDNVMFIIMKAPKTFTGEDVIEITCHNNPFIIEKIILRAIENGARIAQPGEFAKRAYLNGKIDLIQAESINDLINSHTNEALKKSLSQINGSFSNWIESIEKKLLKCLAYCESSFEFIDDEIEFGPQIHEMILELINDIQKIKNSFNYQQQIKEGLRIALIGTVNAGKSSLFNLLIGKNRAIVSNIAGTTRDSVEAGIYTQNHFITFVDTAGLRETHNIIEKEGISRSLEEAKKADIILLIFDGSRKITEKENKFYSKIIEQYINKIIYIKNKMDLKQNLNQNYDFLSESIEISTKDNTNLDLLNQKLTEKIDELFKKNNSPFLLNKRQFNLLTDLENKLIEIEKYMNKKVEYEILSIHLNDALQSITELTGKSISEKAMDTIFKEFCVGK